LQALGLGRQQTKYSSIAMEIRSQTKLSPDNLFRPALQRLIPTPWLIVVCIFAIHAIIRFGGLRNAQYLPLSMVIIWPLPSLLSHQQLKSHSLGLKFIGKVEKLVYI
jgi:hypothetical protein